MEDPIAVLSSLAEEAMRRLGADFKVTVKGDYAKFPMTLTITVEEYEEEASPDQDLPKHEEEEKGGERQR